MPRPLSARLTVKSLIERSSLIFSFVNGYNHLILTGKNGSGKTSLLEAIRDAIIPEQYNHASTGFLKALLLRFRYQDLFMTFLVSCLCLLLLDVKSLLYQMQ